MGYTLKIGQAIIGYDKEYESVYIDVESVNLNLAPAFGDPSDFINERYPSYKTWHSFTKWAGLDDLFYNKEYGILRDHSGAVVLVERHKIEIDHACSSIKNKYPNVKPEFDKDESNANMARLEWLRFWVDWSLENCDKPIFYNS